MYVSLSLYIYIYIYITYIQIHTLIFFLRLLKQSLEVRNANGPSKPRAEPKANTSAITTFGNYHGQRPKAAQSFMRFIPNRRRVPPTRVCGRGASSSTTAEPVPRQSCNASHALAASSSFTAIVTSVVHVLRHVSDETEAAANASKTGVETMLPARSCKNDSGKSLMMRWMRASLTRNP